MRLRDITEGFIENLVFANASKFKTEPEYWIYGDDESRSFCYDCAEKEIEKLSKKNPDEEYIVDGGWGCESDSLPYCETCGKSLQASLTTYACESEIEHFEDNGFDLNDPADCYSMERIMGSCGFYEDELTPRIKRVIQKALRRAKPVGAKS